MVSKYVNNRENLIYYKMIRYMLQFISHNAYSVLDIGSRGINVISDLNAPLKISLDIKTPLKKCGIISIKQDWLEYQPNIRFNVIGCFQVLEHIVDVVPFAQKILQYGDNVLISVSYKWHYKVESKTSHVHGPVCEDKLYSWMGRKYDFAMKCPEESGNRRRLIAYYGNLNSMGLCYYLIQKVMDSLEISEAMKKTLRKQLRRLAV